LSASAELIVPARFLASTAIQRLLLHDSFVFEDCPE